MHVLAIPLLLTYPNISPEIVSFGPYDIGLHQIGPFALGPEIGPFALRWYALAYVTALVVGWRIVRRLASLPPRILTAEQVDDLLFFIALGVILGGRLGYVLFYKPGFFLAHPAQILTLWEGGMSFHGGMLGVIAAILFYAWKSDRNAFAIADLLTPVVPQGLFFGRIANFINGELWGRPSDVAWAMVFPRDPAQVPRHPSQLYQAFFEGVLVTLAILAVLHWTDGRRRPGLVSGTFLIGYGVARIVGELFREPDAHLGFLWGPLTMGMLLSLPMLVFGTCLIVRAYRRPLLEGASHPA